ncbi:hypothetical protein pEaSNUABM11_00178 [Erwinia phage pEa_SNUABM_11]|nr:hypothetical protein pEaSNUABM11_00178 [Erwinia phage pEa_SNUABM_11]
MAIKTPQVQLVELFNAANSGLATPLSEADVDFGAVAAAQEGDAKNSKLTITAKAGSTNFSGAKELTFNRLVFAAGDTPVDDEMTNWDSDAEILGHFNTLVQQTHDEDEFALADITITSAANADDSTKTDVTVAIKAGHVKFLPGEAVVWTISKAKADLSTTNGDLDGFN